MSTSEEIAWAAGIFEGEGCWALKKGTNSSGRRYALLAAFVGMTDLDIILRFGSVVELGKVNPNPRPASPPLWTWTCGEKDAFKLLAMFEPWLGQRRKARFAELLAESETITAEEEARLGPKKRGTR